jgi:hypothetical protein
MRGDVRGAAYTIGRTSKTVWPRRHSWLPCLSILEAFLELANHEYRRIMLNDIPGELGKVSPETIQNAVVLSPFPVQFVV